MFMSLHECCCGLEQQDEMTDSKRVIKLFGKGGVLVVFVELDSVVGVSDRRMLSGLSLCHL